MNRVHSCVASSSVSPRKGKASTREVSRGKSLRLNPRRLHDHQPDKDPDRGKSDDAEPEPDVGEALVLQGQGRLVLSRVYGQVATTNLKVHSRNPTAAGQDKKPQ